MRDILFRGRSVGQPRTFGGAIMPSKVVRYKCDFCEKNYASMSGARRHEKTCFFKPANKSCITCAWSVDPKIGNGVRGGFCQISKQEIFQRSRRVLNCPDWEPEEVLGVEQTRFES